MSWFQRKRGKSQETPADGAPKVEPWDEEPGRDDVSGARSTEGADAVPGTDEGAHGTDHGSDAEALQARRRAEGPHDSSEVDDELRRIDLGAIKLLAREGMELRLEVEDATKRVIAVTVTVEGSSVQLQAFAAPRTDGLWDDIRADIATQITKQGGTADDVPGVFGREILARIPARTADGRSGHRASRFVGVDGPRWFLRGVFTGPAAADEAAATALEDVFRGVVVNRGAEAMAPRDLLALTLPAGARQRGTAAPGQGGQPAVAGQGGRRPPAPGKDGQAGAAGGRDPLLPLERGPEITETR